MISQSNLLFWERSRESIIQVILRARWNRLVQTAKTRKKRGKMGGKWARYGPKRVNKEGTGGINWVVVSPLSYVQRRADHQQQRVQQRHHLAAPTRCADACISTVFWRAVIPFLAHFFSILPHLSPIFTVWTPGIQRARPEVPGENGKKSRKIGGK